APFAQTVDTIKAGNASQKVTGIVTTMFATIPIIKETARLGANFIIAHEPTFYNHQDAPDWVPNNSIVQQKQALLQQLGITVWRFHDYWHTVKPDGVSWGVLKKAGWDSYYKPDSRWIFTLPSTSLKDIALHLKSKLGIAHVRVVGNLSQPCQRIAMIP